MPKQLEQKLLTYDQTMEIVEGFMKKSGIAEYCRTICKGKCCIDFNGKSCYESPNACHRNEGRRLTCTAYICSNIFYRIKIFDCEFRMTLQVKDGSQIFSNYAKVLNKIRVQVTNYISENKNAYFNVPNIENMKKGFHVSEDTIKEFFNDEMALNIYTKLEPIIGKRINIFS